jgi:hypothetical protein
MYIKRVLVIFIITVALGVPLIGITNFFDSNNNNIYNNHRAFAHHMDTATSNEKTVVHQGIIAKSKSSG